jgi:hypothetical protein
MAKRSHSRSRLQRWHRRHEEPVAAGRPSPPPAPRPPRSHRATVLTVALQTASVLACIGVAFALVRFVGAVSDARAYSASSTSVSQMTVTYAGLEAPLASSHPGTRAPQRLCLVALASGGTQYAAILDGRACSALHTGDRPLVRLWRGRVIEVDLQGASWSTVNGPLGAVVGWAVTSILLLIPAVMVTAMAARHARL